jgi:adenylylsulfate kinase
VALARDLAVSRAADGAAASTGWAVWITGRPGSGKTTLAERVAESVAGRGIRVKVLNLAPVRRFLLQEASASESMQEIAHRALTYAAKLLTEAGVAVIVDATAPRRVWREAARELIPCFGEVQLVCPVETCLERERTARWQLSALGRLTARGTPDPAPDITLEYEESLRPELVLHTNVHDPRTTAEQVLFLINRLRRTAPINPEQP